MLIPLLACTLGLVTPFAPEDEEEILTASGEIELPAGVRIDPEGDGALRIEGQDLVLDFGGATLRGAPPGVAPDGYGGVGLVISGENVTVRNLAVSGYRVGILASGCDGLVLEGCDVSDNFRQRLGSTAEREDTSDWLWPHDNDDREWFTNYGAGIWIERSKNVSVSRCRARRGQNGLVLDRVEGSRVFDNDFSFLSGWGIALWRSSDNVIARNACDFCVRGYSHGVYNRGQDSAGILLFEQCSRNVVAENSATHCGDGVFAFAGQEALGAREEPAELERLRCGNNDNQFLRNDLSHAAAHGLELTFSFGNRIQGNRLTGNAICGIWGGYSCDTIITQNVFESNGDAGYGSERGGVNIEHGQRNYITGNSFRDNRCGVHLWWDPDEHLAELPWSRANGHECSLNLVFGNTFEGDLVGLELSGCSASQLGGNTFVDVKQERLLEGEDPIDIEDAATVIDLPPLPDLDLPGTTRPVGARSLGGRESIVLTEWGPYDFEAPLLVRVASDDGSHRYALHGTTLEGLVAPDTVETEVLSDGSPVELLVRPGGEGVTSYALTVVTPEGEFEARDHFVRTTWNARFFAWKTDPLTDRGAWREEAAAAPVVPLPGLDFPFRSAGPGDHVADERLAPLAGQDDRFGLIAETTLELSAGSWVVRTLSDDGLAVTLDGEPLLEEWSIHGTLAREATFELPEARTVKLGVEYFERDGAARLLVDLVPGTAK